jgi:hypothetical protein
MQTLEQFFEPLYLGHKASLNFCKQSGVDFMIIKKTGRKKTGRRLRIDLYVVQKHFPGVTQIKHLIEV